MLHFFIVKKIMIIKEVIMDISKFMANANEKPLDNLVENGGFCSIFKKIAVIGDSLASGEFELIRNGEKTFHDMYDYSWGKFMANDAGIEVVNYSRGGMTAKEYCESFAEENGLWKESEKANAYIIALGVNDANLKLEVGTKKDIDLSDYKKNKPTFIGYYAKNIQRYKEISPGAKFFPVTPPYFLNYEKSNYDKIASAIEEISNIFSDAYLIDLKKYGPDYTDKKFIDAFFLNGHFSPAGYRLSAKIMASYIDYIVRHNPQEFKEIAFTGNL